MSKKKVIKPIQKQTKKISSVEKSKPITARSRFNRGIKGVLPLWIPIFIFFITTLIFFFPHLTGKSFFWEDFTEFVYPTQSFAASQLAKGDIPFWNPYTFSGMPFIADIQVGFFYPFNRLLTFFVSSDGKLSVWMLQFIVILHYFISQLSMYFLSRHFKISSYGSMLAAVSYGFSMIIVCHAIHPMIVEHLAWFPFVILFFYKGITHSDFRATIVAGLILGISMLSGHPQATLYEAFFLGLMFLWYFIASIFKKEFNYKFVKSQNKLSIFSFIATGILPVIIAAGIFCIQYLPSNELADLSKRSEMKYEDAVVGSLEYKQIWTAVVPKLFGFNDASIDKTLPFHLKLSSEPNKPVPYYHYWETGFYIGLTALILGLFGAITSYRSRISAFLIFSSLFGLIFALGPNGFIFPIFYKLPFFGTFRNAARMMMYFTVAMPVLAGFGFDTLWSKPKDKKIILRFLLIGLSVLLISIIISSGFLLSALDTSEPYFSAIQSYGATALILILIIIAVSFMIHRSILYAAAGGAFLIIIAYIDLYIANSGFNDSKENPKLKYTINPAFEKMFKPKPPNEIFRVNMRMYQPVSYMAFNRNLGMTDEIMLLEGYNPLVLQRAMPPLNSRDDVNKLLNVKYEIRFNEQNMPEFYKRTDYLPRAWLVHKAIILDSSQVSDKMRQNGYDYSKVAILEENPGINLIEAVAESDTQLVEMSNPDEIVKCLKYSNDEIRYKIKTEKAGILCISEIWYPAWKAYVNGKETKLLRANYCLRAVPVSKGNTIVELKYASNAFTKGCIISLITFFGSLIGLFLHKKSSKKE